jgi:hypothetical protein
MARIIILFVAGLAFANTASASEPAPEQHLKLGGHFALGVPILTVGTPGTSVIGRDFGSLALVGGVNFAFDAHWSIDFEMIAVGNFKDATSGVSQTTFVFDPGAIYDFGFLFTGVRLAMRVPAPLGGAELGFIPIVGKGFKLNDKLAYYVELDLPMFIHAPAGFTFNVFIQTGIGF